MIIYITMNTPTHLLRGMNLHPHLQTAYPGLGHGMSSSTEESRIYIFMHNVG